MIELGDAFIAFPGGTGTLEEITEVMSMVSLKHLDAPCILYNLNGYYDDLKHLLSLMIEKGLSSAERQKGIFFAETLEEIKDILGKAVHRKSIKMLRINCFAENFPLYFEQAEMLTATEENRYKGVVT